VHIDTIARKATTFEPEIFAKSEEVLAPDPTLWDAWPPVKAHLD
jgi:hypothetical protein